MNQLKLISNIKAKPFIKWAGGKSQLIPELAKRIPSSIKKEGRIDNYIEPFVGGGALFFFLKNTYRIEHAVLVDINEELILAYKVVRDWPEKLIEKLCDLEKYYLSNNSDQRKKIYYEIRKKYNQQQNGFNYKDYNPGWIQRTAYLIFLNKTCYNGLYRQNRNGGFNVPHGSYKNPNICDRTTIKEAHKALRNTMIICDNFENSGNYISAGSFVYLDPPYRPLNGTSSFTSYSKETFGEEEQKRLADFYKRMDKKDAYLMLSNSDPKNENPDDNFFDDLYSSYYIERISAKRSINCIGSKRGTIKELIIRNYI
ncbi:MAG: DNA adenine methylase [Actinomycetota bacterium]